MHKSSPLSHPRSRPLHRWAAALLLACSASGLMAGPAAQAGRLRHVSLFTADNQKLASWYVEMLGLQRDAQFTLTRPDGVKIDVIRLKLGDFLMHVSQLGSLTPRERTLEYTGWRHLSFVVDDVDKAWADLKARGADAAGNGAINFSPPGYRVAFVRDPDGNFVELYQDRVQ